MITTKKITHHTDLLNALIQKHNLKSYLEIGINNPANNFDLIRCETKIGVDPVVSDERILKLTSDQFFDIANKKFFGLIFLDGLHHADQVKKDFENSLKCLSDNGFIVLHDVLPENEEGTLIPRQTKIWWGDVYKWAMTLNSYDGIKYKTFNIDNGCCVVWKDVLVKGYKRPLEMNWSLYETCKRELMNVVDEVII